MSDDDDGGEGDYEWVKCDFSEAILDFRALITLLHFHCDLLQLSSPHACDDDDGDDACLPS